MEPTNLTEQLAQKLASPQDVSPGGASPSDQHLFGSALQPALEAACEDRLVGLKWFRTDWQRGGALTGYASWRTETGEEPVVVKLPVPPQELLWLERLQPDKTGMDPIVPSLYAGGRELGGYDLAWVVMERLGHGPLDQSWNGAEFGLFCEAAGRFFAAASAYPIEQRREEDWPGVLGRSRKLIKQMAIPETQRWNAAIKALQKKLPAALKRWNDHEPGWCHGDLHFGNAMTRRPPPAGPALLFDLARVHTGHWIEDAVYFEHLFWSKPARMAGHNVVKEIARCRKIHGLGADSDWPRLADTRRALLAAASPIEQAAATPNAHHLAAALVKLEQSTRLL